MIHRKANLTAHWSCLALLTATALILTNTTTSLFAQQTALDQLTKENLIGSAVSLSDNDYVEIDKAIQRFRNGDGEGSLEFLRTAKEKHPELPPVEVTFAKMHFAVRNAKAKQIGLLLLERTVAQTPDDPEAYLLLADLSFNDKRIAEAEALFKQVEPLIESFSGNAKRKQNFSIRVLAGHAAVAQSRQQWEKAQKWLLQWVQADPESAAAHQRLGSTLFYLKKSKEAREEFSKAREINPNLAHPFVSLGQLFARSGDNENAQKSFEKAYAEDKDSVATARAYADWLVQQGKLDEAQSVAEALLGKEPESIGALMLDGIVAQMRGEVDHAKQAMTKILSLDPSHFIATDLLSLLLIQSDDVADQERALRYAQMNSQRFPNNSQANITRAWILFRMGRTAEFKDAIGKISRNQVPLDSAFLIAKIMAEQDKKDLAIQEIDKLIKQKTGLFVFRREAEELLKQLRAE